MTPEQAREGSFLANQELFSLNPSALITLFEIDVTEIVFEKAVLNDANLTSNETVFRFHNIKTFLNSSIYWQGNEYVGVPINAEGFDIISQGTLPEPKISICVNDEGVIALTALKERIFQLGDLAGAKVTRIRTWAKYIDVENYRTGSPPEGFSPNPNVELPRDVFYIDRKSNENKYVLEYTLSSVFDVEGIQLPNRLVLAQKCPFQYRGGGCLYEFASRKDLRVHDKDAELPAVAANFYTKNDESILTSVGVSQINDRGEYKYGNLYAKGDSVYIQKNGLKYYFIAKIDNPTFPPPNVVSWIADQCSKSIKGCRLRWGTKIPFGGFPGTVKYTDT